MRPSARSPARRICSTSGAGRAAGAQPALEQLRVAEDGGEEVVEVVRHAAGEAADGLHLLRLPHLLLKEPAHREVLHGADEVTRGATRVAHRAEMLLHPHR